MILTARYVLPVSRKHIEHGAVCVHGDEIVAVGTLAEVVQRFPDEEIKDFGLAALCPGFIDTHTHLEYTAMRGLIEDEPYADWKHQVMLREKLFSKQDWEDSARLGALEATSSGITAIADITETGASVVAADEAGLRGIIYREVETMEKKHVGEVMDRARVDIEHWRGAVDESRLSIGIAPHSAYSCHPELFRAVAEYAKDGTPVAMHLAGSFEEYQFVKYGASQLGTDVRQDYDSHAPLWLPTGVSPVKYVLQWGIFDVPNILAIHCTQVDDDDIQALARYDVAISHCPRCNAKLGMGIAPLQKFMNAGLRLGLGTDSPAASNAMDVFEEMRIGMLIQRAAYGKERFYTASRFLKLATYDAASALGILDSTGSLDEGKKADIIAVDLSKSAQVPTHRPASAMVHTVHQNNVLMTMVAGEVVYADGKWSHLDGERLKVRAEEMREKLRSSINETNGLS